MNSTSDRFAMLRSLAFYAALVLLLLAIFNNALDDVVSNKVARQIGHNSEAYLLALIMCAWIQWVLPWSQRRGLSLWVGVAGGAVSLLIGIALKNSDLDSHYATLNETFFALAFVLPYLHLFRLGLAAVVLSAAIVVGLLIAHDTSVVIKGAESWMVLVLAPLSIDVFDRTIVDPGARESHALRLLWMGVLVALPVLAVLLDGHVSGHTEGIRDYISRANEAFVGLLLVHAYFGYWVRSARVGARTGLWSVAGLRRTA